jgi:hypothetical protein
MSDVPMNNKDLQLNSMIQQMAQQHRPDLPSPGVIWWRAQIQKKFAEQHRIERPLVIMRMLAGIVGLVVVAWMFLNYGVQSAAGTGFSGPLFSMCLLAFGVLVVYLLTSLRESRS